MNKDDKLKILRQLSRTRGKKAEAALTKELGKSVEILKKETDYHTLDSVLEEISIYAFRVPSLVFEAVRELLDRLKASDFVTYPTKPNFDPQHYLVKDVLDLVERIRYFDLNAALNIFFEYSQHSDEMMSKRAFEGLGKCADYDIEIFYSGENRAGFGYAPQLDVIDYLEARSSRFSENDLEAACSLASSLLSPRIEGTTSDYRTISWSKGAVPFSDELVDIRKRSIDFLVGQYRKDLSDNTKRKLLSSLLSATEFIREIERGGQLEDLIVTNTLAVFDWIKSIIPDEELPILQKIEHDIYWRFYHGLTDEIKHSALEIRDLLAANEEFQIFRDLIGYESIFEDWEESINKERDFSKIEENRKKRAQQYAESITKANWPEWKDRIFRYCKVRSNDLATFPIFYDFLYDFAIAKPGFALEVLRAHLDEVELFEIPIFRGLWKSKLRSEFRPFLNRLALEGKQLNAIAKMYMKDESFDAEILSNVRLSAIENEDIYALSQLIVTAGTLYEFDNDFAVSNLFIPALKKLYELESPIWAEQMFFRLHLHKLIDTLDGTDLDLVLSSLEHVDRINYNIENLLKIIAARHPEKVIDLFGRRALVKKNISDYEAVPFRFHRLNEELSKHTRLVVDAVYSWGQHDNSLFQFRGGRLISNMLPEFSDELSQRLQKYASSGNRSKAKFVIGILRNYQGQPFLHDVARQLVVTYHHDETLMVDVEIILQSTGVVTGEYGIANAYARKATEIEHWLSDENENVQAFAEAYIKQLKLTEERERERAAEAIELRKHQFGVNEEKEGKKE